MPRRPPPLGLTYHGVADVPMAEDEHGLFVRPGDLRAQLRLLRSWGYRFVSFSELAREAGRGRAAGLVALTFDDGLADNLDTLVPLLEEAAATATVFAVSGWLGRRYPSSAHGRVMTAPELRDLHAAGVEVGSHTRTHPDLSRLSYGDALEELRGSKAELEDVLGAPVTVAAYPYGYASADSRAACAEAGYEAACRTCGWGSWDDPFDIPRQAMHNGSSRVGLWLKRDDRYERAVRLLPVRVARRASRTAHRLARSRRTPA